MSTKSSSKGVKLTKKQKEVVIAMRNGDSLMYVFYIKSHRFELAGKKLHDSTANGLVLRGIVILDSIIQGGITEHVFRLTKIGKEIDL